MSSVCSLSMFAKKCPNERCVTYGTSAFLHAVFNDPRIFLYRRPYRFVNNGSSAAGFFPNVSVRNLTSSLMQARASGFSGMYCAFPPFEEFFGLGHVLTKSSTPLRDIDNSKAVSI